MDFKVGDHVKFRTHDFRTKRWYERQGKIVNVRKRNGRIVVEIVGEHSGTIYTRYADSLDNPHKNPNR